TNDGYWSTPRAAISADGNTVLWDTNFGYPNTGEYVVSAATGFGATLPPPPSGFAPIRINAGGPQYTDPQGVQWSADQYFDAGLTWSTTSGISGTSSVPLYQTCRYGFNFDYVIPVPNGTYQVNLKFSEVSMTAAGQRVFNVAINGAAVLQNFDVFAQAGGALRTLDRSFPVTVTNGQIVIAVLQGGA